MKICMREAMAKATAAGHNVGECLKAISLTNYRETACWWWSHGGRYLPPTSDLHTETLEFPLSDRIPPPPRHVENLGEEALAGAPPTYAGHSRHHHPRRSDSPSPSFSGVPVCGIERFRVGAEGWG